MKLSKRILSLLLCGLMVLSLVGCVGGGEEGPSGDTVEITWWIATGEDSTYYPTYDDNPVVKYLETKEFNGKKIDLKFQVPVAGAERDNFSTMLGTEQYTDIMNMAYATTSAAELYQDGVIYDLTDYVDQYMPNLKAVLEEFPEVKQLIYSNVDGQSRLLNIGTITKEILGNFMGFLYRRDWIAKYGKNPKTGAAFTYGYSDPNDDSTWYDDVVFPSGGPDPVYISDWEWMFEIFDVALKDLGVTDGYALSTYFKGYQEDGTLFSAFGGSTPLWYKDPDGNAGFGGMGESMKSYIACMNTWYKNGWLDKSFAEHTNDVAYAVDSPKVHTGKVGLWIGRRSETGNLMDNGDPLTSGIMVYGARPPINDKYGAPETQNQTPYSLYQYSRLNSTNVISKSFPEEDLPTLLTFLDYLYTTEGGLLYCLGLNEEQVKEVQDPVYAKFGLEYAYSVNTKEDGTVEYVRNPELKEDNNLASAMAGKRLNLGLYDVGFVPALNSSYTNYARAAMAEWDYYENTGWPDKSLLSQFSTDESAMYSKVKANVDTYMSMNVPKFIKGELDVNGEDWENYCTMLNKYSPDKVTKVYQNLFDLMG